MPISLDLRRLIHKGHSVGWSHPIRLGCPVTLEQLLAQGRCLLHVGPHLGRRFDLPELMLQVSFVQESESLLHELNETIDVLVSGEGLADVVNLKAIVLEALVLKKKDARNWEGNRAGGKIEKLSRLRSPDSVKLCLDQNSGPFPDSPAEHHPAATEIDLLLNEREAFVIRRAIDRRARDIEELSIVSSDNLAGELDHIRLDNLGRPHDVTAQADVSANGE